MKGHYTHGFSKKEKLYNVWKSIRQRCLNKNSHDYKHYGGRGIHICDEWANDYVQFRDWSLSNGYTEGLTIDRVDNDGDYCTDNCRWVTQKQQNRNRSNNRVVIFNGVAKTMTEWAEIYGINIRTLKSRLDNGWSVKDALTKPVQKQNK